MGLRPGGHSPKTLKLDPSGGAKPPPHIGRRSRDHAGALLSKQRLSAQSAHSRSSGCPADDIFPCEGALNMNPHFRSVLIPTIAFILALSFSVAAYGQSGGGTIS